jgi:hypothetical protein
VAFAFRLVGISAFESIREDFLFQISLDRSSYVYSRIAVRSYAICGNAAKVVDVTPGGRIKWTPSLPKLGYWEEALAQEDSLYLWSDKSVF